MATVRRAGPREIADALAVAAGNEPAVEKLWLSEDRGDAVLWLLTRPIDMDEELRLYGLVGLVHDQFPDARLDLHLINPHRRDDLRLLDRIPAGAVEIELARR